VISQATMSMGRSPPARRTAGGVLNTLVSPLLFAADDIVEAYRAGGGGGPGQDAAGWVLSPLRVAGRYLRIMRDQDDSSGFSGASTHSHASGDDALQLKRRQVSVTRCARTRQRPGSPRGGRVLHTPAAAASPGTCVWWQARALILRQPPAPQGGQLRPTGHGL
jgi:hypothetical protein